MKNLSITIIICLSVIIISAITFKEPNNEPHDYIKLEDGMKGLMVSSEGIYGTAYEQIMDMSGRRVKHLMVAIEIYQGQGYELIKVYGNNAGHYAVMRKMN